MFCGKGYCSEKKEQWTNEMIIQSNEKLSFFLKRTKNTKYAKSFERTLKKERISKKIFF